MWACWVQSVFQWYDYLAAIFIPSLGIEDIITHIEALTKFTQQALNDSNQAVCLLSSEISMMRKAVLQNCMALNILTASQGGAYAVIHSECFAFIPDESSNATPAYDAYEKLDFHSE